MNLIRLGKYDLALSDANKALESSDFGSAWLVKAHALLGLQKNDEAIQILKDKTKGDSIDHYGKFNNGKAF